MNESHYRRLFCLKEEDFEVPDENFIQRIWFENLFQNPLKTAEGRQIEVLQPGFWNRGAGPDFYNACIRLDNGREKCGSVEIHLSPLGWRQHGHDGDAHYNRVILHVFWNAGPRDFFAGTSDHHSIPQVELCGQLQFSVRELRRQFKTTVEELKIGARVGRCNSTLGRLPGEEVETILSEAGLCRFEEKCRLFQMRKEVFGGEQTLWIGLAEAMGYSLNTAMFHSLAQRLPVRELQRYREDAAREARLFGMAGLLPGRTLSQGGEGVRYLKTLWETWWKERAALLEEIAPRRMWNLRGLRPLNRPERRLAALAMLAQAKNWERFLRISRSGDPVLLREMLRSLQHPFWDSHYTFESRISGSRRQLIGESRMLSMLFNCVWPYAVSEGAEVRSHLESTRMPENNRFNRTGRLRLLSGRRKTDRQNSILMQEGLIQIYRNFCLNDRTQCRDCLFPKRVEAVCREEIAD